MVPVIDAEFKLIVDLLGGELVKKRIEFEFKGMLQFVVSAGLGA